MWENLLEMATESGIWAVMFIVLFYKQMKESKTREQSYQSTIDKLADKLKLIADIKIDIQEIKDFLSIKRRFLYNKIKYKQENNKGNTTS